MDSEWQEAAMKLFNEWTVAKSHGPANRADELKTELMALGVIDATGTLTGVLEFESLRDPVLWL